MERHQIIEAMTSLKLYGMRASFDEVAGKGLNRREELYPLLASLIRAEITHRQSRSINYRLSGAKFPVLKFLEAHPLDGPGPGFSKIFIDDMNALTRPAKSDRAINETILQLRAFLVMPHLVHGRLADINVSELAAMHGSYALVRSNRCSQHADPPLSARPSIASAREVVRKPCAICFCVSPGKLSQSLGSIVILGFGSSVMVWDATRNKFNCMFIANHLLNTGGQRAVQMVHQCEQHSDVDGSQRIRSAVFFL